MALQLQHHMIVRSIRSTASRSGIVEITKPIHLTPSIKDGETPGHAQMDDQHLSIIKMDQEVFRPSAEFCNPLSGQGRGKPVRKREPQLRPSQLHGQYAPPLQDGSKAATHCLNFRQFRHGPVLAFPGQPRYGPAMNGNDKNLAQTTAAFGFTQVEETAKQGLVNEVFSKVASRYDQMNDLMSGGLHRLWKDDFIAMLNPPRTGRNFRALDVAGGTGDIAFRIARAGGSETHVTVADISPEMVAEGAKRAHAEGLAGRIDFTVGNAEALPFADCSFDSYTIAFGIRNVTHIDKALREARRVLRTGGRFLCLEFSSVDVPGLKAIYDAYSFTAIPAIGKIVTGDGHPYRYLVESIRTFPEASRFEQMIRDAGFERTSHRSLTGGIVAIHSGWRI